MTDIVERLRDLHKQATSERSHFYVGKCTTDAIDEIERLRRTLEHIKGVAHANLTQPIPAECDHRWATLPDPMGGHFVACTKCPVRRHID